MNTQEIYSTLDSVAEEVDKNLEGDFKPWAANYFRNQRTRFAKDVELALQHSAPGGRILDIGAAPYFTTGVLAKMDRSVAAIDVDPSRFGSLPEVLGFESAVCNCEIEPLPYPDNSADVILFCEVFEHMRINLIYTTSELLRVLKPGGKLLLSTPNFLDIQRLVHLLVKGRTSALYPAYAKIEELGHMGHTREYTAGDVSDFVTKVGFNVTKTIYRGTSNFGRRRKLFLPLVPIRHLIPRFRNWFMLVLEKPVNSKD